MLTYYDGTSGREVVKMPRECAFDCSEGGRDALPWVEKWLKTSEVCWKMGIPGCKTILIDSGGWTRDEVAGMSDMVVRQQMLWIAACDLREEWEEKVEKYRANRYQFPPPPVYTGNWNEESWINYIDQNGEWL